MATFYTNVNVLYFVCVAEADSSVLSFVIAPTLILFFVLVFFCFLLNNSLKYSSYWFLKIVIGEMG